MDDKLIKIKLRMFKFKIKQIQLAKYLDIPDCILSKMLNNYFEMPDEIYLKIEKYLQQFETQTA